MDIPPNHKGGQANLGKFDASFSTFQQELKKRNLQWVPGLVNSAYSFAACPTVWESGMPIYMRSQKEIP